MRIEFIDGLRGLMALGVVYLHYCFVFFHFIPMGFYNSCVVVCEFFVISGFVLSFRFWKNRDTELLTSSSLRRYVRLTAAPLVSILLSYLLIKVSFFYCTQIIALTRHIPESEAGFFYLLVPSLTDALHEGLWGMYFDYHQSASYSPVLWTMKWEFKGSILVAAFLALFGKVHNRWILYVIFLVISIDTLYPTFIFGVMFSDLLFSPEGRKLYESLKKQKIFALIMLGLGIFFSIYSTDFPADIYRKLEFEFFNRNGIDIEIFYHMLASVMIMYAVVCSDTLQKFFSCKFLTKIGEYSFSLYLLHVPILCSVGGFIFLKFFNNGFDMVSCIFLGSSAAILVTIPAVYLLHHFVDMPAGKLAKYVQKKFE